MSNIIKSRFLRKWVLVSIAALMVSAITFVYLSEAFALCFSSPGYYDRWETVNSGKIEALQVYVTENDVTVAEAGQSAEWAKETLNFNVMLSENPTATFLGNNKVWNVNGIALTCADGIAYIYAGHSKNKAQIAAFPVAAGSFLLITIPYTYKTVQRIMVLNRKIDSIYETDAVRAAEISGNDELMMLENGIENLKLSVISQLDKKNNDLSDNSHIIKSLAHDIRTPLTRLTGYLDILRYKKFNDSAEFDHYIASAARNAQELKLLTDELLEGANAVGITNGMQVNEMISEAVRRLDEAGFNVACDLSDETYCLKIHGLHMQRIIDNLSSNIEKYADDSIPVAISLVKEDQFMDMNFFNHTGEGLYTESNGIGLPTVKLLTEECGGSFEKNKSEDTFEVAVKIPLVNCKTV